MARYPQGAPIRLSTTVSDLTGWFTDPTTITLTVRRPDLTLLTFATPIHDSVGHYHQDVPSTDVSNVGRYSYKWVTEGVSAGVVADIFDVYDPLETRLISLADARNHLNITTNVHDDELQTMVDTADEIVGKLVGGPVLTATITERVRAGQGLACLAVRQRPLISVVSITDIASGTALPVTDLDVDTSAGLVRRKSGTAFGGSGVYTVVYTAGLGMMVPAPVQMAAKIIVAHLWETQRGPAIRPQLGGGDMVTVPGMGYAVPNRAVELLAPYAVEIYV